VTEDEAAASPAASDRAAAITDKAAAAASAHDDLRLCLLSAFSLFKVASADGFPKFCSARAVLSTSARSSCF
jgi:hypothetical protein